MGRELGTRPAEDMSNHRTSSRSIRHRHGAGSLALLIVLFSVLGFMSIGPTSHLAPGVPPLARTSLLTSTSVVDSKEIGSGNDRGTPGHVSEGPSPAVSYLPYMKETLVLGTDTLVPGTYLAANGVSPVAAAYDPGQNEVFIADQDSNNVQVISDVDDAVVATIPVGATRRRWRTIARTGRYGLPTWIRTT